MDIDRLILHVIAGIASLWLATKFVSGVDFTGTIQTLLLAGTILGLINFFLKPLLRLVTLPLRILTLGLFSIVINMLIVWLVADVLFPGELEIQGIVPLFWTTVIVWATSLFLGVYRKPTRKVVEIKE